MNGWTILRRLAGVLIGGVATGLLFLIMVQGSLHQGITDFDFAHVLGTSIEGTAVEETGGDALAVVGDSAGPTALYATVIASIVLLAFHALVVVPLVRAHWVVQGTVLAVVAFLAIGLIYVPYAASRLDTPIGAWGVESGAMTPVVLGLSALGSCLLGARCYDLAKGTTWWQVREIEVDSTLEELGIEAPSLELSEERPEQGGVRP